VSSIKKSSPSIKKKARLESKKNCTFNQKKSAPSIKKKRAAGA
jgi:hypothetical protein